MKKLLAALAVIIILFGIVQYLKLAPSPKEKQTVVFQESVITKVIENSLPSVVTVGISATISQRNFRRQIEANIGSGFVISHDGLIITNKHVVADEDAKYKVLTNDKKSYNVEQIYRDPLNDLAILKINSSGIKTLKFGNSSVLKLGQLVIAIGTPLGEFTNTVTTGIISGLGRGITAGSPFEGYVEKLDNVIQTDAAISPGNSGGPLLNSKGQVIGVNTAVAAEGQNIGFAIPADVIKELINSFQKRGGNFERPYIGVRYRMLDKKTAAANKLVEGAYVIEVVGGSPADRAGLVEEDVIIKFDGKSIQGDDNQSLTRVILEKQIGQVVRLKYWRNGQTHEVSLTLEAFK